MGVFVLKQRCDLPLCNIIQNLCTKFIHTLKILKNSTQFSTIYNIVIVRLLLLTTHFTCI